MDERATHRRGGAWSVAALLRPHAGRVAGVVGLQIVLAFANMALPFCLKLLIDDVLPGPSGPGRPGLIWIILPGLALVYVFRNVVFYASRILAVRIGEDVCAWLRRRLFDHLQEMSLSFHRSSRMGEISSRLMDDTQEIRLFIADKLPKLILSMVLLVTLLVVIYSVNWILAIVSSLVLPLHFLAYRYFIGSIRYSHGRAQEKLAVAHGSLLEHILGAEVVKSFSAEERESARFSRTIADAQRSSIRTRQYHFGQKVVADLLIGVGIVVLLGLGAWHVIEGVMTTGDFLMFFGYVMMLYPAVQEVLSGSSHLTRAGASTDRVFDLLHVEGRELGVREPKSQGPPAMRGDIVFDNVHFAHDDSREILRGLSFEIRAGEHVAFIGPSGVGKTTLAGLIPAFHFASAGRILIDGRDVTEWRLSELRRAIGIAFQEVFLFDTSILENVLYGRYEATVQEIIEACKVTGAHDFIDKLPVGYGATPNELGGKFSRGEKQRITLARALLNDPRILILDEATASLDPRAGAAVMQRVLDVMHGRTVIMITHDPELAQLADRIITLGEGGVVVDDRPTGRMADGVAGAP